MKGGDKCGSESDGSGSGLDVEVVEEEEQEEEGRWLPGRRCGAGEKRITLQRK